MARLLEALDGEAGPWFTWAWGAALVSLAVLAALLALRPLLGRALSSHARSWLWLLPLVPLAAPPLTWAVGAARGPDDGAGPGAVALAALQRGADLVAPPGWFERTGERATASDPGEEPSDGPRHAIEADGGGQTDAKEGTDASPRAAVPPAHAVDAGPALPWRGAVLLGWWLAAAALLALHVARCRRTRALVEAAEACGDAALRRRVHRLAREAGVDARIRVLVTDRIGSPAVAGALRPAVLLPAGLTDELDREAFDWILRHELEHIRRRDLLIDALVAVLRAVWFLHPAVWLAPRIAQQVRELACDEAALARSRGTDGASAASALLHVLERGGTPLEAHLPGAIPLTRTDSLERQRIMRLLAERRPTRRLGALPAAGLGLASVLLLASGLRPAQDEPRGVQLTVPDPALVTLRGALQYLVENQQQDGRWRAVAGEDGGAAGEFDDVGVTGVALQALAACPDGAEVEGREAAMTRGLAYLAAQHDGEGGAFKLTENSWYLLQSHAMATLGWIRANEALGALGKAEVRGVTQRAIEMVSKARNPYRGWGFDYPPSGRNYSAVTGWMLLAVEEARDLDLRIDGDAVIDGLALFEEWYDADTGRIGWDGPGAPTSRLVGKKEAFPGEQVEFPTAVATLAKIRCGVDIVDDPTLFKSAALLVSKAPVWSRGRGTIDSYYWAFGTMAVQPFGGVVSKRWNAALVEALTEHAERTRSGARYWEAIDAWHDEGSEVAMTAMCALALSAAVGE